MIEKEFVPYNESLELKELGFDEPCFGYYDNQIKELDTISSEVCERLCKHDTHTKAPTFSQIFRWFREKYNLEGYPICVRIDSKRLKAYQYVIISNNYQSFQQLGDYSTYEEAELACLKKLISIVKKNKL